MSLTPEEIKRRKVERHKKAAAEMKAALIGTQQKTPTKVVQETSEMDERLKRLQNNIGDSNSIKIEIVKDLNYLYDNQDQIKLETGKEFLEIINDLGISQGYYYEQLQAYNLCLEYSDEKAFNDVDTKILVKVARIKDKKEQKEYFNNIYTLSKDDFEPGQDENNEHEVKPIDEIKND